MSWKRKMGNGWLISITTCHSRFHFCSHIPLSKKLGLACYALHFLWRLNFLMQIHPVVSRLCASIQGTSPERLADCLGLDSSKVKDLFPSSITFNCRTFDCCSISNKPCIFSFSSKVVQVTLWIVILPVHSCSLLKMRRGKSVFQYRSKRFQALWQAL